MPQDKPPSAPRAGPKLPRIPQGSRIHKRPLTRPQSSSSSKLPVLYISSHTPFMSIIHRTRTLLTKSFNTTAAPKNATLQSRVAALERSTNSEEKNNTVVKVLAAGRAVDKAVHVAAWFQQQGDCNVEMRTRSMATVDDVVGEQEGEDCFGVDDESRLRNLSVLELCISLK